MLKLKNITKIYKVDDTLQVNALENINLDFEDTGFVCILGHSGCGKTTLLNIIYILFYSLIGITIIAFALIIAIVIILSKQR